MKRPTFRGTAKWGLTGAAVVLAVLWPMSYLWALRWSTANSDTDARILCGAFMLSGDLPVIDADAAGLHADFALYRPLPVDLLDWAMFLKPWWLSSGAFWGVNLPLWLPLSLAALPGGFLWRADWRRRARRKLGGCSKCAYDRRGLAPAAFCPECGTVPAP